MTAGATPGVTDAALAWGAPANDAAMQTNMAGMISKYRISTPSGLLQGRAAGLITAHADITHQTAAGFRRGEKFHRTRAPICMQSQKLHFETGVYLGSAPATQCRYKVAGSNTRLKIASTSLV